MSRRPLAVLVTLAAALLGAGLTGTSSAVFTARSFNGSSITAADDWTPPTVSVDDPGASLSGIVEVSATASDVDSGIAGVVIQYAGTGGGWTTVCATTSAPYRCTWDTVATGDGAYDLRAVATDRAGYAATSTTVATDVVNTARVVLVHPSDVVRGAVLLGATLHNTGNRTVNLSIEYRATGGTGAWSAIGGCSTTVPAPLSCTWDSTLVASDSYDLRAVAVIGSETYTDAVTDVLIDNVLPGVAMIDPGSPLRGTVTLGATSTDDESGVAQVVVEYAPSGGSTWTTTCVVAAAPYSCRVDTTALEDGSYDLRAAAIDNAGNVAQSPVVKKVAVNNTVASVSIADPGGYLSGTVVLTADAASSRGVASVTIQRRSGAGAFTDVCVDISAPYTCSWDTTLVPDGMYDLRAVLTDGRGDALTSAVVTGRRVDNQPLRAADVQSVNRGEAGRMEAGDEIAFTYTGQVATGSILTGWTGAAQSVTVRIRDGKVFGLSGTQDVLDVQTGSGATVQLGAVDLLQDYVRKNKTVTLLGSQMTATVTTVNGAPRTVVTVTLGTPSATGQLVRAGAAAAMVWTPATAATSPAGQPCSAAPVTESGANDRDF